VRAPQEDKTMTTKSSPAFGRYIVNLPVTAITAQRQPTPAMQDTICYKRIAASLDHIGLIEPLVVFEQVDGSFLLIDGNTRFAILKAKGILEVACIMARDDEAYTYNRRVSHVPAIAQHFMLLRVLENGVSEDRIAAALNIDVRSVREKRDMLKGICPEVIGLLEGRRLSLRCFSALRKMKPIRQIEATEHMIASNNFGLIFLRAILSITKPEMLSQPDPKGSQMPCRERNLLLEREHEGLVKDLKAIQKSYGLDMLTLAVSLKYLERILKCAKVKNYLKKTCPETLALLLGIIQEPSAGEPSAA
jgi:RepB plasmid partitioning protein